MVARPLCIYRRGYLVPSAAAGLVEQIAHAQVRLEHVAVAVLVVALMEPPLLLVVESLA